MSFGLRMTTDLSGEEIAGRVDEPAEMMGIEDLLDEPLSNLDAKLRTHMRTEIRELQSDLGITTVYVTHNQTEAMTMGDKIAVLNDGELQQLGTPLECYYEPRNVFVAGFIGEPAMNLFALDREDDRVAGTFSYPLTDDQTETLGTATNVTLGIRPEDIELVAEDDPHAYRDTVRVVEPMGDESYLVVDSNGAEVTLAVDGAARISDGDEVRIRFPPDRVHLFDSDTGNTPANCAHAEDSSPSPVLG
jgi:multiple sugar transport system ATP-binding protein